MSSQSGSLKRNDGGTQEAGKETVSKPIGKLGFFILKDGGADYKRPLDIERMLKIDSREIERELNKFCREKEVDINNSTEEEKLRELLNWLGDDKEFHYTKSAFCIREMIKTKKGNCVAFSTLFKILANKLGLITGFITNYSHTFNWVKINNEKIEVDAAEGVFVGEILKKMRWYYSNSREVDDGIIFYDVLLRHYVKTKKIKDGREHCEKYIINYPNNPFVYYDAACFYKDIEEYKNAIRFFDRVIKLDSFAAEVWVGKGESYYKLDDIKNAKFCFANAIEIQPALFAAIKEIDNELAYLSYRKAIEINGSFISQDGGAAEIKEIALNPERKINVTVYEPGRDEVKFRQFSKQSVFEKDGVYDWMILLKEYRPKEELLILLKEDEEIVGVALIAIRKEKWRLIGDIGLFETLSSPDDGRIRKERAEALFNAIAKLFVSVDEMESVGVNVSCRWQKIIRFLKHKRFTIKPVAKKGIINIFGEKDTSWQHFFINPKEEKITFKEKFEELINNSPVDIVKREALLVIWQKVYNIFMIKMEINQERLINCAENNKVCLNIKDSILAVWKNKEIIKKHKFEFAEIEMPKIKTHLDNLFAITNVKWEIEEKGAIIAGEERKSKVQKVGLKDIIPTQFKVLEDELWARREEWKWGLMFFPVVLVKVEDKYYLKDGHHRYWNAFELGVNWLFSIVLIPGKDLKEIELQEIKDIYKKFDTKNRNHIKQKFVIPSEAVELFKKEYNKSLIDELRKKQIDVETHNIRKVHYLFKEDREKLIKFLRENYSDFWLKAEDFFKTDSINNKFDDKFVILPANLETILIRRGINPAETPLKNKIKIKDSDAECISKEDMGKLINVIKTKGIWEGVKHLFEKDDVRQEVSRNDGGQTAALPITSGKGISYEKAQKRIEIDKDGGNLQTDIIGERITGDSLIGIYKSKFNMEFKKIVKAVPLKCIRPTQGKVYWQRLVNRMDELGRSIARSVLLLQPNPQLQVYYLIDGHHTIMAAKELRMEEYTCLVIIPEEGSINPGIVETAKNLGLFSLDNIKIEYSLHPIVVREEKKTVISLQGSNPRPVAIDNESFKQSLKTIIPEARDEDIEEIIRRLPQIHTLNLENNIKPKVEYFRSLGTKDILEVLRYPQILNQSLGNNIKPYADLICSIGIERKDAINEIKYLVLKKLAVCKLILAVAKELNVRIGSANEIINIYNAVEKEIRQKTGKSIRKLIKEADKTREASESVLVKIRDEVNFVLGEIIRTKKTRAKTVNNNNHRNQKEIMAAQKLLLNLLKPEMYEESRSALEKLYIDKPELIGATLESISSIEIREKIRENWSSIRKEIIEESLNNLMEVIEIGGESAEMIVEVLCSEKKILSREELALLITKKEIEDIIFWQDASDAENYKGNIEEMESWGLTSKEIGNIIKTYPRNFITDLHKKRNDFEKIDINPDKLGKALKRSRMIFTLSMEDNIRPKIELISKIGIVGREKQFEEFINIAPLNLQVCQLIVNVAQEFGIRIKNGQEINNIYQKLDKIFKKREGLSIAKFFKGYSNGVEEIKKHGSREISKKLELLSNDIASAIFEKIYNIPKSRQTASRADSKIGKINSGTKKDGGTVQQIMKFNDALNEYILPDEFGERSKETAELVVDREGRIVRRKALRFITEVKPVWSFEEGVHPNLADAIIRHNEKVCGSISQDGGAGDERVYLWSMDRYIFNAFEISIISSDIFNLVVFHQGEIKRVISKQTEPLDNQLSGTKNTFGQRPYFNMQRGNTVYSNMTFAEFSDYLRMGFKVGDSFNWRDFIYLYNLGNHQAMPDFSNYNRRGVSDNFFLFAALKEVGSIIIETQKMINEDIGVNENFAAGFDIAKHLTIKRAEVDRFSNPFTNAGFYSYYCLRSLSSSLGEFKLNFYLLMFRERQFRKGPYNPMLIYTQNSLCHIFSPSNSNNIIFFSVSQAEVLGGPISQDGGAVADYLEGKKGTIEFGLEWWLMTQTDFFKYNFLKRFFVPEALYRIKDFYASELALGVIVSSNALGQMFGRNLCLFESDIKGIYFRVIGDTHISSLLEIVNINSDYHYFILFFNKYRPYLFSFVIFIVPVLIIRKAFPSLQAVQFCRFPFSSSDNISNFFFSSASIKELLSSMFTQTDRFRGIFHKFNLSQEDREVNGKYSSCDSNGSNLNDGGDDSGRLNAFYFYFFDAVEMSDITSNKDGFVFVNSSGNKGVYNTGIIDSPKTSSNSNDRRSNIKNSEDSYKGNNFLFLFMSKGRVGEKFVFSNYRNTRFNLFILYFFQEKSGSLISSQMVDDNIGIDEVFHKLILRSLKKIGFPFSTDFILKDSPFWIVFVQYPRAFSDNIDSFRNSRFLQSKRGGYQPFYIFYSIFDIFQPFHYPCIHSTSPLSANNLNLTNSCERNRFRNSNNIISPQRSQEEVLASILQDGGVLDVAGLQKKIEKMGFSQEEIEGYLKDDNVIEVLKIVTDKSIERDKELARLAINKAKSVRDNADYFKNNGIDPEINLDLLVVDDIKRSVDSVSGKIKGKSQDDKRKIVGEGAAESEINRFNSYYLNRYCPYWISHKDCGEILSKIRKYGVTFEGALELVRLVEKWVIQTTEHDDGLMELWQIRILQAICKLAKSIEEFKSGMKLIEEEYIILENILKERFPSGPLEAIVLSITDVVKDIDIDEFKKGIESIGGLLVSYDKAGISSNYIDVIMLIDSALAMISIERKIPQSLEEVIDFVLCVGYPLQEYIDYVLRRDGCHSINGKHDRDFCNLLELLYKKGAITSTEYYLALNQRYAYLKKPSFDIDGIDVHIYGFLVTGGESGEERKKIEEYSRKYEIPIIQIRVREPVVDNVGFVSAGLVRDGKLFPWRIRLYMGDFIGKDISIVNIIGNAPVNRIGIAFCNSFSAVLLYGIGLSKSVLIHCCIRWNQFLQNYPEYMELVRSAKIKDKDDKLALQRSLSPEELLEFYFKETHMPPRSHQKAILQVYKILSRFFAQKDMLFLTFKDQEEAGVLLSELIEIGISYQPYHPEVMEDNSMIISVPKEELKVSAAKKILNESYFNIQREKPLHDNFIESEGRYFIPRRVRLQSGCIKSKMDGGAGDGKGFIRLSNEFQKFFNINISMTQKRTKSASSKNSVIGYRQYTSHPFLFHNDMWPVAGNSPTGSLESLYRILSRNIGGKFGHLDRDFIKKFFFMFGFFSFSAPIQNLKTSDNSVFDIFLDFFESFSLADATRYSWTFCNIPTVCIAFNNNFILHRPNPPFVKKYTIELAQSKGDSGKGKGSILTDGGSKKVSISTPSIAEKQAEDVQHVINMINMLDKHIKGEVFEIVNGLYSKFLSFGLSPHDIVSRNLYGVTYASKDFSDFKEAIDYIGNFISRNSHKGSEWIDDIFSNIFHGGIVPAFKTIDGFKENLGNLERIDNLISENGTKQKVFSLIQKINYQGDLCMVGPGIKLILEFIKQGKLEKLLERFEERYWRDVCSKVNGYQIEPLTTDSWRPDEIDVLYYPGAGEDILTPLGVHANIYKMVDISGDGKKILRSILTQFGGAILPEYAKYDSYGSLRGRLKNEFGDKIEILSKKLEPNRCYFEIIFRDKRVEGKENVRKIEYYYNTDAVDGPLEDADLVLFRRFPIPALISIEWKVKFLEKVPIGCYIDGFWEFRFPQFLGLRQVKDRPGYYIKEHFCPREQLERAFRLEDFLKRDTFAILSIGDKWEEGFHKCQSYVKEGTFDGFISQDGGMAEKKKINLPFVDETDTIAVEQLKFGIIDDDESQQWIEGVFLYSSERKGIVNERKHIKLIIRSDTPEVWADKRKYYDADVIDVGENKMVAGGWYGLRFFFAPYLVVERVQIPTENQGKGYETLALALFKLYLLLKGNEGGRLYAWFGKGTYNTLYSQKAFARIFEETPWWEWEEDRRGTNERIPYEIKASKKLREFIESVKKSYKEDIPLILPHDTFKIAKKTLESMSGVKNGVTYFIKVIKVRSEDDQNAWLLEGRRIKHHLYNSSIWSTKPPEVRYCVANDVSGIELLKHVLRDSIWYDSPVNSTKRLSKYLTGVFSQETKEKVKTTLDRLKQMQIKEGANLKKQGLDGGTGEARKETVSNSIGKQEWPSASIFKDGGALGQKEIREILLQMEKAERGLVDLRDIIAVELISKEGIFDLKDIGMKIEGRGCLLILMRFSDGKAWIIDRFGEPTDMWEQVNKLEDIFAEEPDAQIYRIYGEDYLPINGEFWNKNKLLSLNEVCLQAPGEFKTIPQIASDYFEQTSDKNKILGLLKDVISDLGFDSGGTFVLPQEELESRFLHAIRVVSIYEEGPIRKYMATGSYISFIDLPKRVVNDKNTKLISLQMRPGGCLQLFKPEVLYSLKNRTDMLIVGPDKRARLYQRKFISDIKRISTLVDFSPKSSERSFILTSVDIKNIEKHLRRLYKISEIKNIEKLLEDGEEISFADNSGEKDGGAFWILFGAPRLTRALDGGNISRGRLESRQIDDKIIRIFMEAKNEESVEEIVEKMEEKIIPRSDAKEIKTEPGELGISIERVDNREAVILQNLDNFEVGGQARVKVLEFLLANEKWVSVFDMIEAVGVNGKLIRSLLTDLQGCLEVKQSLRLKMPKVYRMYEIYKPELKEKLEYFQKDISYPEGKLKNEAIRKNLDELNIRSLEFAKILEFIASQKEEFTMISIENSGFSYSFTSGTFGILERLEILLSRGIRYVGKYYKLNPKVPELSDLIRDKVNKYYRQAGLEDAGDYDPKIIEKNIRDLNIKGPAYFAALKRLVNINEEKFSAQKCLQGVNISLISSIANDLLDLRILVKTRDNLLKFNPKVEGIKSKLKERLNEYSGESIPAVQVLLNLEKIKVGSKLEANIIAAIANTRGNKFSNHDILAVIGKRHIYSVLKATRELNEAGIIVLIDSTERNANYILNPIKELSGLPEKILEFLNKQKIKPDEYIRNWDYKPQKVLSVYTYEEIEIFWQEIHDGKRAKVPEGIWKEKYNRILGLLVLAEKLKKPVSILKKKDFEENGFTGLIGSPSYTGSPLKAVNEFFVVCKELNVILGEGDDYGKVKESYNEIKKRINQRAKETKPENRQPQVVPEITKKLSRKYSIADVKEWVDINKITADGQDIIKEWGKRIGNWCENWDIWEKRLKQEDIWLVLFIDFVENFRTENGRIPIRSDFLYKRQMDLINYSGVQGKVLLNIYQRAGYMNSKSLWYVPDFINEYSRSEKTAALKELPLGFPEEPWRDYGEFWGKLAERVGALNIPSESKSKFSDRIDNLVDTILGLSGFDIASMGQYIESGLVNLKSLITQNIPEKARGDFINLLYLKLQSIDYERYPEYKNGVTNEEAYKFKDSVVAIFEKVFEVKRPEPPPSADTEKKIEPVEIPVVKEIELKITKPVAPKAEKKVEKKIPAGFTPDEIFVLKKLLQGPLPKNPMELLKKNLSKYRKTLGKLAARGFLKETEKSFELSEGLTGEITVRGPKEEKKPLGWILEKINDIAVIEKNNTIEFVWRPAKENFDKMEGLVNTDGGAGGYKNEVLSGANRVPLERFVKKGELKSKDGGQDSGNNVVAEAIKIIENIDTLPEGQRPSEVEAEAGSLVLASVFGGSI